MNFKNGKIIIFSGAGISAESGLATFRDSNGLWANYDINVVCNYHSWRQNYELVHKFYNLRREELARVKPNIAHQIAQKLAQNFEVINITQNVDDLFERAYLGLLGDFNTLDCHESQSDSRNDNLDFSQYDNANILHLHGKLWEIRCEDCENIINIGYAPYDFSPCPKCGNAILKPNIVFFYEQAPKYAQMYEIFERVSDNDIIIVSGTSGEVVNVCAMINKGYKILNNLKPARGINENLFDSVYLEPSTSAFPKIYDEILRLKNG
ncbi:SIR2 family NAD-dependent protein deacylase [Helicobacter sp. 23-1044]